jgi:hypothetical protein
LLEKKSMALPITAINDKPNCSKLTLIWSIFGSIAVLEEFPDQILLILLVFFLKEFKFQGYKKWIFCQSEAQTYHISILLMHQLTAIKT